MEYNKLFHGDVFELLRQIPDESIDMVWGDPDYNVGIDYSGNDYTMPEASYNDWYISLAKEGMRVLKKDGNMFLMNYDKQNMYLAVNYLYDNSFNLQNYVWCYTSSAATNKNMKIFNRVHRSILHARKTNENKYYPNEAGIEYAETSCVKPAWKRKLTNRGRNPLSWFIFNHLVFNHPEKTEHPCQIPSNLYSYFLRIFTQENDNVLVLFGGSGGELIVTENLKRKWLSAEIHSKYVDLINSRLKVTRENSNLF